MSARPSDPSVRCWEYELKEIMPGLALAVIDDLPGVLVAINPYDKVDVNDLKVEMAIAQYFDVDIKHITAYCINF